MPAIPIWIMIDSFGMRTMSPDMLSMSRVLVFCSKVPTQRNSSALVTAWKRISRIAGPERLVGADAPAQHDEPEVGDGGPGQHPLGVALRDGDQGGDEEGDAADRAPPWCR